MKYPYLFGDLKRVFIINGAPVFENDNNDALAQKCDMCIDRLEAGEMPICVLACSARALDFGPLSEMQKRYGKSRDLEDLSDSKTTQPAVVLKPHPAKKPQIIPYNAERAFGIDGAQGSAASCIQLQTLLKSRKGRWAATNW